MVFNLKQIKKAQPIPLGVGMGSGTVDPNLEKYVQTTLARLKTTGQLPTDEEKKALEAASLQLQNGHAYITELQAILNGQLESTEDSENLQSKMVAPEVQQGTTVPLQAETKNDKKIVAFNLKKAFLPPIRDMETNDNPEIMGDNLEREQQLREEVGTVGEQPGNVGQVEQKKTFTDGEDVRKWLDTTDETGANQFLAQNDDGAGQIEAAQELVVDYYRTKSNPLADKRDIERKGGEIYDALPPSLKQEQGAEFMTEQKVVTQSEQAVIKIANGVVSDKKKIETKPFNLHKQAQHKTNENVIMWGPENTRKVDPFLRQPVSDWHIVERNKGFGLVVDDVWNIDWETLWRQNVMDKYSRPYRDASGAWVGGYINKRFEVDRNIPETSNYQLKPGQKRKPVLPEYGSTESRLQAARAAGDVEGANDTSKPFNWKEAQTKKKSQQG